MNTSWSYSMFSTAVQCLHKYKLCYIDKVVPDVPESGDLLFGSALHSALNSVISGDDGGITFDIYWTSYKSKDIAWGRFKWEELRELGLNFISKFTRLHAKRYKVEKAEVRLYGEYKGIKLEGTFDFYGTYDGHRSLRDFKTSGYNYPKEKESTALQLYLYTYLAGVNGYLQPETLGYTVFNKGTGSIQDLTWAYSPRIMEQHLDNLVEYCKQFDSQEAYPKNLNSCIQGAIKCQYFDVCHVKNKT